MLRFVPTPALAALRTRLLFEGGWGGSGSGGEHWLDAAAGNCLDIELNVTWPGATVPPDFGSVGVKVLGAPGGAGDSGGTE
eukprot:gene26259-32141_t